LEETKNAEDPRKEIKAAERWMVLLGREREGEGEVRLGGKGSVI
jgi:hypothetical protein